MTDKPLFVSHLKDIAKKPTIKVDQEKYDAVWVNHQVKVKLYLVLVELLGCNYDMPYTENYN